MILKEFILVNGNQLFEEKQLIKVLLPVFLFILQIFPQEYEFYRSIGNFRNANSFHINSSGFLFISDKSTDEIYKLDTLGNLIGEIGGFGWKEATFDFPADVFANPLSVYVSDYNNHRIQRFDRDLNFISMLSTRDRVNEDERFGYPLACVTSNQGDLFILDSENKRIVKFDIFGNFIMNFGSYDAGNFQLSSPVSMAVSESNNLWILENDRILIFDQYGNGIRHFDNNRNFTGIRILYNWLCLNSDSEIYAADLREKEFKLMPIPLEENAIAGKIINAIIFDNNLFVLTKKQLYIFRKIN
ncbi:MAG: hypothetical protein Kow0098_17400 [Ignavibacteriaceae bacterium]